MKKTRGSVSRRGFLARSAAAAAIGAGGVSFRESEAAQGGEEAGGTFRHAEHESRPERLLEKSLQQRRHRAVPHRVNDDKMI